jgi:hypothetical protein
VHTWGDESSALDVGATRKACPDDLSVELGHQQQLVGLVALAELLDRPRRLVREHGPLDADPTLEISVVLCPANLDHPTRSVWPRSGPGEGVRGNRKVPPAIQIA